MAARVRENGTNLACRMLDAALSRLSGYRHVSLLVAVLLIGVGLSKLLDSPGPLFILLAIGEVSLGLWLLTGASSHVSWTILLVVFGVFAGVSLSKAFSGVSSCGCLGAIDVKPSLMAFIDLLIIVVLIIARPPAVSASAWIRGAVLASLFSLVGLAVGTFQSRIEGRWQRQTADDSDTGLVILDGIGIVAPHRWIGSPCPLLKHIDIGNELTKGEWSVILYRPGCPSCETLLHEQTDLEQNGQSNDGIQLAMVSISTSEARERMPATPNLRYGALTAKCEWMIQTPLRWTMSDGKVIEVLPNAG